MEFGSKFVYLGNIEQDEEVVDVLEGQDIVLSDEDSCSDDDGETCLLDILDTAGQEEYSSMRDQYVRDGDGFAIIYSVTDKQSFTEAETIHTWIKRVKGEEPFAILVANKQDLDTEAIVTTAQGQALATKLGIQFFQTSAKTGQGVEDAMSGLVRVIPRVGTDYKIAMLGSGAVGKSSITLRFVNDTFVDDYDPTIEDSYRKMIRVSGVKSLGKDERKAAKKNKKIRRKAAKMGSGASSGLFGRSSARHRPVPSFGNSMGSYQQQQMPQQQMMQQQMPQQQRVQSAGLFGRVKSALRSVVGSSSNAPPQQQQQNHPVQQQQQQAPPPPPLPQGSFLCSGGLPPPPPALPSDDPSKRKKITTKKADCNVVLIPFRDLANDPNLVTGDPITCAGCQAVLTSTATLVKDGDSFSWTCEFCGHKTSGLDISPDEIPKGESIDFMLAPPTKVVFEEAADQSEAEQKKTTPGTIVYCMDISSSMAALCSIPESQAAWREERSGAGASHITRLACIRRAVERLAEQLKFEEPEKKVMLVVFGSHVQVLAGGSLNTQPRFDAVENKSMQKLLEMGLSLSNEYPLVPIEQSHEPIANALASLRTEGCTALGPALAISVGFVSKTPGSEVVLCTDGEPNVGVGSLNRGHGGAFYREIGTYAREKNVTINILAMEGASVGLNTVSEAAETSGGTTNKLNPAEIVRQLRTIAQNEVIAHSVTVTFYLSPDFVFDEFGFPDMLSKLEKEVGSVRKETDMSFHFKLKDPNKSDISSVPFQVQIRYTRGSDGMKCLRVLSKRNEATRDRKSMEENVNVAVMGVAVMKTTAQLAKLGKGKDAQHRLKNVKRMVKRGAWNQEQQEERLAFNTRAQDWDDELTDRNDVYTGSSLCDSGAHMVQQATSSNMVQQSAFRSKQAVVFARKAKAATKKAYYGYTDDM